MVLKSFPWQGKVDPPPSAGETEGVGDGKRKNIESMKIVNLS